MIMQAVVEIAHRWEAVATESTTCFGISVGNKISEDSKVSVEIISRVGNESCREAECLFPRK